MSRMRVVIFEDEPIIAADIQQAVEDASCVVCGIFSDSSAAEAIYAEIKPDLAIVDLHLMDGDTGADLAHYLHQQGCEIVVFSATRPADARLCSISHTYIGKPLSPYLLTQALRPNQIEPVRFN